MNKNYKQLPLMLCLSIFILGVFIYFAPELDQFVARLPYDFTTHKFYGEVHTWCRVVFYGVYWLTLLLILLPLINLYLKRHNKEAYQKAKRLAAITLLTLAIGPGLIVNVVFKDHWGRTRPHQVLRDGGSYTPIWQPQFSHSRNNNSFPSGHASIGFMLGIPFLAFNRRRAALLFSFLGGFLVGGLRILQGGHYLSDVVFAGVAVWISAFLVMYLVDKLRIGASKPC